MADLKVDYEQLTASRDALERLTTEYSHATDLAHASEGIWGHSAVKDAINDFAGNWKIHREKLLDHLHKVSEMTEKSLEAFEDADSQIARGVEVRHDGPTGHAR